MKHFGRSCVCFLKWLCKASLNKLNCLELTFKVKLTEKARVEHKENKEGSHLHRFLLSMSPVDCFFFFPPLKQCSVKCLPACMRVQSLSHVWLFLIPWASQTLLSVEFSKQEYWSGLPFPPSRNLLDPGIEPTSPASPALADEFFTTESPGPSLNAVAQNHPLWDRKNMLELSFLFCSLSRRII